MQPGSVEHLTFAAVLLIAGSPVFIGFRRMVRWGLGVFHSPGCAHRDAQGRGAVGQTFAERFIYTAIAVFGLVSLTMGMVLVALILTKS